MVFPGSKDPISNSQKKKVKSLLLRGEQRIGVYRGQKRYCLKSKVVFKLSPNLETVLNYNIIGVS